MRKLMLLGLLFCSAAFAQVHEYTLKNGLKLFVKPDTRAPVVVVQVWYRVGSSYEPNGITGISHVLEHMMFRGSKKYSAKQFSRIIAENGGENNAFTYYDYTGYYEKFSADKLPIAFQLEADRMHGLLLWEKDFEKEIQIVMEERRMRVEDNPQSLLLERFNAAAYVSSPYHHMVIGWPDDLKNMNIEDVRRWYHSWYAPNNAIIVVVGDVKPDQAYRLAKKYFSRLDSMSLPELKPRKGIKAAGERDVIVRAPAKLPFLLMGYNVPVVNTAQKPWIPYALDVLTGVLSGGESARLPSQLVRGQQIAAAVDANYNPFMRMSSLLTLSGVPAPGHTAQQLQQALLAQLRTLKSTLVSPQELARIKAQVIAAKVYQKDSMTSQAMEIGMLESVGLSWRVGEAYVKNIEAVTAEQVHEVAQLFLVPARLTVGVLKPQNMDEQGGTNESK